MVGEGARVAERQAESSQSGPPAGRRLLREPIVFEGNAPANVRDNPVLRALLDAQINSARLPPRVWLGAPNSIKGPTEAMFRRQSGNHLLIVGQREEAALGHVGRGAGFARRAASESAARVSRVRLQRAGFGGGEIPGARRAGDSARSQTGSRRRGG